MLWYHLFFRGALNYNAYKIVKYGIVLIKIKKDSKDGKEEEKTFYKVK